MSREKIRSLDELTQISGRLRESGKVIVQCHGVFDLLHPGHIRHFEAARREGDILLVTVTRDEFVNKGPGRPVFNQWLRAEAVAALQCVDYVALSERPTAVEAIRRLRPHVYVKGSDYADPSSDATGGILLEEEAVKSVGGRVCFTDEITFSSTQLLNEHFDVYPEEAQRFLREFRSRYSASEVIGSLRELKRMRVMVIGEAIVDEYHYCQAIGKSPKETIVTTKYIGEEAFAGGALACANHVAGFCEDVGLVTCLGALDPKEEFIRSHLRPNVTPKFFYRNDSGTIVKRRFVDPAFLSKMFEISFLEDRDLPEDVAGELRRYLESELSRFDLILVTDYGHGLVTQSLINLLCEKSRFLAINTQTNSANTGYNLITKYPRVDYFCIDEPEIRLATQERFGRLENLIVSVTGRAGSTHAAVTRGHLGSITYSREGGFHQIPVLSQKIVDRVGAGDAYLSITSPCVAAGLPMDLVGFVGNAAGALAVAIVCNRSPIEPTSLFKFISSLLK
jgi:rfaE bifunctional protein nucleotidyltransferase chain/domain